MSLRPYAHAFVSCRRLLVRNRVAGELKALSPFIRETDVCFDVGAHCATWSHPLARMVRRGHVYAFEALPYYQKVLSLTMKLLQCRNVTVIGAALGEQEGSTSIVWADAAGQRLTGRTSVAAAGTEAGEVISVPCTTLDEFSKSVERPIRFMKIDVAGFELPVIRGAMDLLERDRPILYCNCPPDCERYDYTPADMIETLADAGYDAYIIALYGGFVPVDARNYPGGETDLLFTPRELDVSCRLSDYEA